VLDAKREMRLAVLNTQGKGCFFFLVTVRAEDCFVLSPPAPFEKICSNVRIAPLSSGYAGCGFTCLIASGGTAFDFRGLAPFRPRSF